MKLKSAKSSNCFKIFPRFTNSCAQYQPGVHSSSYQRHLDTLPETCRDRSTFYELDVAGYSKQDLSRTSHTLLVSPSHEEICDAVVGTRGWQTKLNELVPEMPPAYHDHPIVKEARLAHEPVVGPLALYLDGLPYSLTDSVLAFWLEDLVTTTRYCIAIFRKRLSCKCGCKGWCSLFPIWMYVRYVLLALARGMMPESRHNGTPFRETDIKRAARRGEPMPRKFATVYVKGDWMEYSGTIGFSAHNDGLRPCFECVAFGMGMYEIQNCFPSQLCWHTNDDDAYDFACSRCEILVELDAERKAQIIKAGLRYDKRSHGSRGRCLVRDVHSLNLRGGDRLEPCAGLLDVGQFESLAIGSLVVFWRTSAETMVRHRCPIFCDELGISPKRNLTVDALHAIYLGVMNVWCKLALWFVLLSGWFGRLENEEETLIVALHCLKHALMHWYKERHRSHPMENLTRVSDFTMKMLGTKDDPKCKTKGAETFGIMLFLLSTLEKYSQHLTPEGRNLQVAGEALARMLEIFKGCDRCVSATDQEQCFRLYKQHVEAMRVFETFVPKHHIIVHMLDKMSYQGNPVFYATWLDESLNKVLKAACRFTSQSSFELSVLTRMRQILQTEVEKRARR